MNKKNLKRDCQIIIKVFFPLLNNKFSFQTLRQYSTKTLYFTELNISRDLMLMILMVHFIFCISDEHQHHY